MDSRYSLLNVFTGFRRESQFYVAMENISFIFGVVVGGVGLGFLGSLYDVDGLLSVMDVAEKVILNRNMLEQLKDCTFL